MYRSLHPNEDQWTPLVQMTTAFKPLQVATTAVCETEIVSMSLITKHLVVNGEDQQLGNSRSLLEMI